MKQRFVRAAVAAAVAGTVLLGMGVAGSASYRSEPKPKPAGPHITASPSSVVETSVDGAVGFAVHGSGFFSNEPVSIDSPALDTACTAVFYEVMDPTIRFTQSAPLTVTTDFSGMFNVAVQAIGCAPGTYQITAFETLTPNRTATTSVTIKAPVGKSTGVRLSPSSQIETGTTGSVATTLIIQGFNPQETFTVASPALQAACTGGVLIDEVSATPPAPPPAILTTDFAGNDVAGILASGCHAGRYPITVTENGAGHRSFTVYFTILRP